MGMELAKERADFLAGRSFTAWRWLGGRFAPGAAGAVFRVYAPGARGVGLIAEWNGWQPAPMAREPDGFWVLEDPAAQEGGLYKYRILGADGRTVDRADPFALCTELRPGCASRLARLAPTRARTGWRPAPGRGYDRPMSIYELHAGSWRRRADGGWLFYGELAQPLIPYLQRHGFTHVELLPLAEHPFDGSWGYQVSGYFSATSRYGDPRGLQYLIDELHRAGIGVLMDFVPVHFVADDFGLHRFDGTPLYEYEHPDIAQSAWGSCNFDYYKPVVRSFLQSAADFWLSFYHCDGLRMDAVSNALYWQGDPSRGVNVGGVEFLRGLNSGLHRRHPDALLMAEDSSTFLKVTAPVEYDGLGFDYKWDMGWMHDTLDFFAAPPDARGRLRGQLAFSMQYFAGELYLLPLSHDEVVHGKKTILDKLPGGYEEKFAQCRALFAYMFCHPGKKLNFMGNELGQFREWDEGRELDWNLLDYPMHAAFDRCFAALGELYLAHPALWDGEYDLKNWALLDTGDPEVFAFSRTGGGERLLFALNLSGALKQEARVAWRDRAPLQELLNTDEQRFGGAGRANGPLAPAYGGVVLQLAPFAAAIFACGGRAADAALPQARSAPRPAGDGARGSAPGRGAGTR